MYINNTNYYGSLNTGEKEIVKLVLDFQILQVIIWKDRKSVV